MSRRYCIPGVLFLLAATVLSALVAVGLPYVTVFDIARTHFSGGISSPEQQNGINQIRFGTWAFCTYDQNHDRFCSHANNAYQTVVQSPGSGDTVTIGAGWTRGLAVHPVAAIVTFIAFLVSLSTHITVQLVASILSFLAAILTLIAFAIDIALYAWVKHQMNKVDNVSANTKTGPGFWLTFASLLLTLLAGCTVCLGRRRERMYNATTYPSTYPANSTTATEKPSFFSRFRRTA